MKKMSLKILLVEDDLSLQKSLKYILESDGFVVDTAGCGEEALMAVKSRVPDIILLDLGLPDMDGFEVCEKLKRNLCSRECMIIMITGRNGVDDITRGLNQFADDYITKPFEPSILLARIHAVLRRKGGDTVNPEMPVLRLGDISVNSDSREVTVSNRKLKLTKTEFDILHLLAGKPDYVFPRSAILDHVREHNLDITDRIVDYQISGLRKKMGKSGERIVTVRGVGYKIVPEPAEK